MKTRFLLAMLVAGLGFWTGLRGQTFVQFSINQPAAPAAGFSFTVQNTTYTFTDLSSGSGLSYAWDFGDGNTSTAQSPVHTYATDGSYTICLTITDGNACTSTHCDSTFVVGIQGGIPGMDLDIAPNPFSGQTVLSYRLPEAAEVSLSIHNLLGAEVQRIDQGAQDAGKHSYSIGANLAAGTYLMVLEVNGHQVSRRIIKAN